MFRIKLDICTIVIYIVHTAIYKGRRIAIYIYIYVLQKNAEVFVPPVMGRSTLVLRTSPPGCVS